MEFLFVDVYISYTYIIALGVCFSTAFTYSKLSTHPSCFDDLHVWLLHDQLGFSAIHL